MSYLTLSTGKLAAPHSQLIKRDTLAPCVSKRQNNIRSARAITACFLLRW
jgi:hypothetical protein